MAEVVGAANLHAGADYLGRYTENVSGWSRRLVAVVKPASTSEVQRLVRIANQHGLPLFPLSSGKNWGLGSRLPVRDDQVVVDLSRMNAIREINAEHAYAVVEAGVTQGQLAQALRDRGLPLLVNVTGSASGTSLIGNSLERGIGYFASRAADLSGLEVVLGNGEILKTGFGHYPNAATVHLYKYGIGPDLAGLFSQSNYGIVTAAGVSLLWGGEHHVSIVAKLASEARLEKFVDVWASLRRRGVIHSVVHIGNRSRTEITLAPLVAENLVRTRGLSPDAARKEAGACLDAAGFGPWSGVAGIRGPRALVKQAVSEARRAFRGVASVQVLTDTAIRRARQAMERLSFLPGMAKRASVLSAVEAVYGLSQGVPSSAAVKSVYWPIEFPPPDADPDPDHSRSGMLYCLPFMPMSGKDARATVKTAREVLEPRGFSPSMTLNLVDGRAFECVISIAFDRAQPDQVRSAQGVIRDLQKRYIDMGYYPYRVGVQSMDQVVSADDPFWQTARELKKIFDPNGIISPGRYNLV